MKAFWFHLKLICVFASIYGNISSRSTCEATGEKKVWIFLKVSLRNPSILLKRSFITVSGFTWSFYSFVNLIHLKPSRFFFGVVLHLWYLYNLKKCNRKVFPKRRKKNQSNKQQNWRHIVHDGILIACGSFIHILKRTDRSKRLKSRLQRREEFVWTAGVRVRRGDGWASERGLIKRR